MVSGRFSQDQRERFAGRRLWVALRKNIDFSWLHMQAHACTLQYATLEEDQTTFFPRRLESRRRSRRRRVPSQRSPLTAGAPAKVVEGFPSSARRPNSNWN